MTDIRLYYATNVSRQTNHFFCSEQDVDVSCFQNQSLPSPSYLVLHLFLATLAAYQKKGFYRYWLTWSRYKKRTISVHSVCSNSFLQVSRDNANGLWPKWNCLDKLKQETLCLVASSPTHTHTHPNQTRPDSKKIKNARLKFLPPFFVVFSSKKVSQLTKVHSEPRSNSRLE